MKSWKIGMLICVLGVFTLAVTASSAWAAPSANPSPNAWSADATSPPPAPGIGYWYEHSLRQYFTVDGRPIYYVNGQYQWANGQVVTPYNAPTTGPLMPIGTMPDASSLTGGGITPAPAQPVSPMLNDFIMAMGQLTAHKTYTTGVQMNVNVYNRAPMLDGEYYWVGVNNFTGPAHPDLLALEYVEWDPHNYYGWFEPIVHIRYASGSDWSSPLASSSLWINGNSSSWHWLQATRSQSTGTWYVASDGVQFLSNLYWTTSPYSYYPTSHFELPYTSVNDPNIHDPANHFSAIMFRASDYSTWCNQTSANVPNGVDQSTWWVDKDGTTQHPSAPYNPNLDFQNQYFWYDWMAHPNG